MKKKSIRAFLMVALLFTTVLVGCNDNVEDSMNERKLNADANKKNLSVFLSFDQDKDPFYVGNVKDTNEKFLIESLRNDVTGNKFFNEEKAAYRTGGVSGEALAFDGYTTSILLGNPLYGKKEFTIDLWMAIRAYDFVDSTRNITPLVEYYDASTDTGFMFGYLSTNLSAFGGLTNGNPANASANIPVGPLTGIGFHAMAANVFKMDNLVIKEIKAGTKPVILEDDTALPGLPIAAPNNSAVNFTSDNYKVEAKFDVLAAAPEYSNVCMLLVGANGVTGCIDAVGATSINVQLNVNTDGTATPVMYHFTPAAGWLGVNGTTITLPTEGEFVMTFVSCGDNIFWYINGELVLSTTYSANGMIANHICSLGLFEIAGALEYSTYTYTALTKAEIQQYS